MCIILTGLFFMDFELSPQKLWVSQDSITNNQQLFFGKKFGTYFRVNQIIYHPIEEKYGKDIFNKETIEKLYYLQNNISKSQIEFNNKNYTVDDLCYKPVSGKGCMITSPMSFWKNNLTALQNTKSVVCRSIVTNNHFPIGKSLCQYRIDGGFQSFVTVICCHHD